MNWTEIAGRTQLAATMGMLGVIWVIQLCVYPRFEDLAPDRFPAAHSRHCAGIGLVVAPLMGAELFAALYLVWAGWGGSAQWAALVLTAGTWLSTAMIQAPCHRRLMQGYDQAQCRSLTQGNWIRTVLWSAKAVLVFVLCVAAR